MPTRTTLSIPRSEVRLLRPGRSICWVALLALMSCVPLLAQDGGDDDGTWGGNAPEPRVAGDNVPVSPDGPPVTACDDGVVMDDGVTDIAYGWVPSVERGRYVQEFSSSQFSTLDLESVCVCFRRTAGSGNDDTLDFRVVIYDSELVPGDGDAPPLRIPADEPRLAVDAVGEDIPIGTNGAFFEVPMQGSPLPVGTFYLGVEWNASTNPFFFLCSDSSPETPPVKTFFREDLFDAWSSVFKSTDGIFLDYKSLMVRAVPNTEEVVDIPTLGTLGGSILALALGLAGLWAWRRRA